MSEYAEARRRAEDELAKAEAERDDFVEKLKAAHKREDDYRIERDRLRERLDQFEAYGMPNVAAVLDRVSAAECDIADAKAALRFHKVPEQIPPLKTPLAPVGARILFLGNTRDTAVEEVDRLVSLVQNWYEGRVRIGASMTFVDQRFYDAVRCERTGWPGDDANGDGGPPEE